MRTAWPCLLSCALLTFATLLRAAPAEPLKLAQAISLAEQQGHGKTVQARAVPGATPAFQVTVLSHDGRRITQYRIDARTGGVVASSSAAARPPWTGIDTTELENAQTSIGMAITSAETRAHGRARGIAVSQRGGQLRYTVDVGRRDGGVAELMVDGSSGRLAAAP